MKRICVFCGAHPGENRAYYENAKCLGEFLVKENFGLVYGGANIGIMGEVANSVLAQGGDVIGVITEHLMPIEGHTGLKDLRILKNMHQRKAMMYELSDGFAVLPGGIGTLEEFFEILTWAQLKFHTKPIGILNTEGYYNRLIHFLHHIADENFMHRQQLELFFVADTPEIMIQKFKERIG
ncbi:MAG TPA: TIGR00730 family Rossman fold protein [Leptospiraceae bacterium]|nr:TIGR00730 family Rossman fold protein [Leptospiraceae bacterium]HMW07323.1 TIGR00730 family Rossman fold protein [Leptospiraceae bacterium]HMX34057.1 TIGR00730 family Rossman fold protein [Leptospiraceae bacterium]HMY32969.1 TIGR00730 family Rossman fold protein [Leptospiraceae bacterium]HMZ64583.1 TIGR00730 family Rossman fold protein [Leptospiraceae bacterium]